MIINKDKHDLQFCFEVSQEQIEQVAAVVRAEVEKKGVSELNSITYDQVSFLVDELIELALEDIVTELHEDVDGLVSKLIEDMTEQYDALEAETRAVKASK
jgi:hypothetical protein